MAKMLSGSGALGILPMMASRDRGGNNPPPVAAAAETAKPTADTAKAAEVSDLKRGELGGQAENKRRAARYRNAMGPTILGDTFGD